MQHCVEMSQQCDTAPCESDILKLGICKHMLMTCKTSTQSLTSLVHSVVWFGLSYFVDLRSSDSGYCVRRVNQVTLRRSRLELGWVTHEQSTGSRLRIQPPKLAQPSTFISTGYEYWSRCADALQLGSRGRMAHCTCG